MVSMVDVLGKSRPHKRLNMRELSDAVVKFLRDQQIQPVTLDAIVAGVTGRHTADLRPLELAVIGAAIENSEWTRENGQFWRR